MNEKSTVFFISSKESTPNLLRKLKPSRRQTNSEIYKVLKEVPLELVLYMMAKAQDENIRKSISLYVTHLQNIEPLTKGKDLKKLGLIPGPIFRTILEELKNARMNGEVSSRDDEIKYVKNHFLG